MPVMVAACDMAQSTNTTNRLQPWYLLHDDSDDSSRPEIVYHRASLLLVTCSSWHGASGCAPCQSPCVPGLDHCIRLWEMQPTRKR